MNQRELDKLRREVDDLRREVDRMRTRRPAGAYGFAKIAVVEMVSGISGRDRVGDRQWGCSVGTVNVLQTIYDDSGTKGKLERLAANGTPETGELINIWRMDLEASSNERPITLVAGMLGNRVWVPLSIECDDTDETTVSLVGSAIVGTSLAI